MIWLKRKSKTPAATAGQDMASKALGKAEKALEVAEEGHREVMAEARKLRKLGERNNFADAIRQALGDA